MTNANGRLHLWAFLQGVGFHPGGWRHQDATPKAVFDAAYYQRIGQMVEKACFDAVVFGDQLQGRDAAGRTPERLAIPTLDPFSLLSLIASSTSRVGLVATVSTTYNEPQEVAAKFATLDYLSQGRAGWNIVTTAHPNSPWNFGQTELLEKSLRYKRAKAFVDEAATFWDQARQRADAPSGVAAAGRLDFPAPPQGRPVLVQAGQSGDGRDFAASTAEAIFCPAPTLEAGRAYRDDIRGRVGELGRDPNSVIIMPGLAIILGGTEEEARRKEQELQGLADDGQCIEYLSESIGYDLTQHHPDGAIPIEEIAATCEFPADGVRAQFAPAIAAGKSLKEACRDYARKPRGHAIFCGTPEQLADHMQTWIEAEACDGFTLQPAFMPTELEIFCAEVAPLLQQRGLLRRAYQGAHLRDHLDLPALG